MNPEHYASSFNPQGGDNRLKKRLIILFVLVVVVFLGLAVQLLSGDHTKAGGFAIIGTTPSLSSLNTLSTSVAINFNEPISASSVSVTSSPSIISSTSVRGAVLTIHFIPDKLSNYTRYAITVRSVSSTSGKQITNHTLSFKPTLQPPNIVGEDSLYAVGLNTSQIGAVNAYISSFKPWAQNVTIDASSVNHYRDPSDDWSVWHVSFNMSIDGTNYSAVTNYYLSSSIQLQILDPTNSTQLFEAGSVSE